MKDFVFTLEYGTNQIFIHKCNDSVYVDSSVSRSLRRRVGRRPLKDHNGLKHTDTHSN